MGWILHANRIFAYFAQYTAVKKWTEYAGTLFWTQPAAQFTVFPPAQLRIRAKCGGVHALKREWRTQGLINLQMWLVKLSQIDEKELKSFA